MRAIGELQTAVQAVCPILGLYTGVAKDRSDWGIWPDPSATKDQIAAAMAVIQAHPFVDVIEADPVKALQDQVAVLSMQVATLATDVTMTSQVI